MIGEKLHLACLGQQRDLLVGQAPPAGHQVGSALEGPAQGLHPPPGLDGLVVPRPQHLGDHPPAEVGGPRVLRVLQEPPTEALVLGRGLVAQSSREQAGDRLDDDERGELTPGDHDVADGQLRVGQVVGDPLVHSLVTAAQQREAVPAGEVASDRLIEAPAAGGKEEERAGQVLALFHALDGGEQGLGHEHHARATPERRVVDGAARVGGAGAQVPHPQVEHASLARPTDEARPAVPLDEVRKDREDVDPHGVSRRGPRGGPR